MLGLTILWNEAKRIAKQRKEKVSYREVKVTCQEIGRMQVDKFRAAEKRWAEEDRLLALMK
jgi:hypothetical protein